MSEQPSDTYGAVLSALADVAAPTDLIGWALGLTTEPVAPAASGASERHRAELAALSLYHLWGRINAGAHQRAADAGTNQPAPGSTASIRSRLNVAYMAIMDGELRRAVRTLAHIALDAQFMCEDYEDHRNAAVEPAGTGRMIEACPPQPTP